MFVYAVTSMIINRFILASVAFIDQLARRIKLDNNIVEPLK